MNLPQDPADCYSASERKWMYRWQRWRGLLLAPLLLGLSRMRVRPDHLSVFSLLSGLGFSLLFSRSPFWALAALLLHVLADALDGPLARYQQSASRKGSFTDSFCDQVVIVASTLTLISQQLVSVPAGGLYLVSYTVVVGFAMLRNALHIPYSWLLRPRLIVYVWIGVELWLLPGTLEYLIWACNLLFLGKLTSGFFRIRARM